MDHIAIMSVKIPFLARIFSGEKTMESRWYSQKRVPWNVVAEGDWIYFKNVAQPVTLKAQVAKVQQYDLAVTKNVFDLIDLHAKAIGLRQCEVGGFVDKVKSKRYAIFMHLHKITAIVPLKIGKKGFGSMAAWITVPNIHELIVPD